MCKGNDNVRWWLQRYDALFKSLWLRRYVTEKPLNDHSQTLSIRTVRLTVSAGKVIFIRLRDWYGIFLGRSGLPVWYDAFLLR